MRKTVTDSAKAPSKGAMRAAKCIEAIVLDKTYAYLEEMATVIDRETKAGEMAERLSRSKTEHFAMAAQLDLWAVQSVQGGWSTHQVDAMRCRADVCRKYGAEAERLLTDLEVKP